MPRARRLRPAATKVMVGPAGPGIEHGNMLIQLGHKVLCLLLGLGHGRGLLGIVQFLQVAQFPPQRISPGRQIIPPRPARGLRMRSNHRTPGLTRSSQSRIPFGLPFRTRKTIVEV